MREPRNPFRLRASEHIESAETFVRLFTPEVLDMLSTPDVSERPLVIRSAPGGGKTSLLRLFTPSSLRTIHALRTQEHTKDLFKSLSALEALDDSGPCVLGVFLSCAHSFATLDDLDLDDGRKKRLFLSLLNARIVLSALRGILDLQQMDSTELSRISLRRSSTTPQSPDAPSDTTGPGLHDWAERLERSVCEALDSFSTPAESVLPGHESLMALDLLVAENILFNGMAVAKRVLVMLDDIHRLTLKQRKWLIDAILSLRPRVGVWIAERLEALSVDELLSLGALEGRDYDEVRIEDYWRGSKAKFERMVSGVADRRARGAHGVEIEHFAGCLQDTLDGEEWQDAYLEGVSVVAERVRQTVAGRRKFGAWISDCEESPGTPRERLLSWRTLEILVERELRKAQQTLPVFELDAADLEQRGASYVEEAAELFVAHEFHFPYYYGLSRLASVASSNIEQFLSLSGDIFEECVSAALLRPGAQLALRDQERILRNSVKAVWKELPQRVRYGTQVKGLLESVGKLAQWETEKPNAPYAPGVTGVAISMEDLERLKGELQQRSNDGLTLLAEIIASCIAHNLLEVKLNQKCKGRYWMVMYLNRMLCVHFNLPLQYGGWREKRLSDLCDWLAKGFTPPKNRPGLFG